MTKREPREAPALAALCKSRPEPNYRWTLSRSPGSPLDTGATACPVLPCETSVNLIPFPRLSWGLQLVGGAHTPSGGGVYLGGGGLLFQHFLGPRDRFTVISTKESCGTVNLELLLQHRKPALRHGMLPISLFFFFQHFLGPCDRLPVISTSVFDLAIAR